MISKLFLAGVVGSLVVTAAIAQTLPESPDSNIGYATVNEALKALHARPDVVFSVQNGWTIADDAENRTLWSFTPAGYPAYPAVVKRQIKQANGAVDIETHVLCHGTKTACDQLVQTFQHLNDQMKQRLVNSRQN